MVLNMIEWCKDKPIWKEISELLDMDEKKHSKALESTTKCCD